LSTKNKGAKREIRRLNKISIIWMIIPQPHHNNGHPLLQQSYLNGKLLFVAIETAMQYGGYMEGAVIAIHIRLSVKLQDTQNRMEDSASTAQKYIFIF